MKKRVLSYVSSLQALTKLAQHCYIKTTPCYINLSYFLVSKLSVYIQQGKSFGVENLGNATIPS